MRPVYTTPLPRKQQRVLSCPHMAYDMLAIGDTVIDNFIRLKDAHITCKINEEECEICMRWGDKIPFESATEVPAVGNAANAAVSAARLGLSSALRTYLGNDPHGDTCIESLRRDGVSEELVVKQDGKLTNYHYVLWFDTDRTILIKHEQYDYAAPELAEPPKWVYLTSLGENSLPYHAELAKLLASWSDTKLAFQPGTFQMKFGTEALKDLYARTDVFFCNKEEARRITGSHADDVKELFDAVRKLGPKTVVITDGKNGAYASEENGAAWRIPIYPDPKPPFERTGAGDAFSSTVVAALALGKPLTEALLWGPVNSMAVVQDIGAQRGLLSREKLEEYLKNAPADYQVTPF